MHVNIPHCSSHISMSGLKCFRNLSWMQGATICKQRGGHLPFINSENDANSLTQTLNDYTDRMTYGIRRDWKEILPGEITFLGLLRDQVNIFVIENSGVTKELFW